MTIIEISKLIKKNIILFIIFIIIFFSISFFLTSIQLKKTENMNDLNIEIFYDRDNSRDINFNIEKLKIFFYILTNAYNEVGAEPIPLTNYNVLINKERGLSGYHDSLQELRIYQGNYIDLINNELVTLKVDSQFQYNHTDIINKYFNDNFDINHFSNFISLLKHRMLNNNNLKSIEFKITTDDPILAEKYIFFLIEVFSHKIWNEYNKYLYTVFDLYSEHFSNLLTISKNNIPKRSPFSKLLINTYGLDQLNDFIENNKFKRFNYDYSLDIENYKKTFSLTQPSLLFFIIFSIIASFCIILLKEKIYKKN